MSEDINFVETDSETIKNQLINDFETALNETLYPGDEHRIFLMQLLPVIIGMKNDINNTGRQNLLRYASRQNLDELGGTRTLRLQAKKAVATLRFTLSSALPTVVTIAKCTRATPDGSIYFSTTDDLIIPSGQTYGDIRAESIEAGEKYNGYVAGQIKNIVDPVAYVASVTNIDESSGGSDVESDDSYRERIRQAPESYSTTGPDGGYIYWAKTADVNIADIAVTSPTPGVVKITVLMKDGQIPTQTILDAVNAAVSAKNRRPLTDNVQVISPSQIPYDINLIYYISTERQTEEATIKNAVEGSGGIIDQYKLWQTSKLGREINPDYLRQLMFNAGVYRIDVTSPSYTALQSDQVAQTNSISISYGGLI